MSRIRSIKPEWLEDERMALASSDARTLSIALILLADDFGNGRAGRVGLAGRVFPGKTLETLDTAMAELVTMRYALLYEIDGQRYFSVRNWDKHQRVDRPGSPKVPGPNLALTDENHGDSPPPGNSQEKPASPQELPGEISTRAILFPSSGSSSSLFQASSDQPEKPGSARARRKPRAKVEHIPAPMRDDWLAPADLVAALAVQYSVTDARIVATTPEFIVFWKRRGDRKKPAGWDRAFSANVERLAKRGALYVQTVARVQVTGYGGHTTAGDLLGKQLAEIAALEAEEAAR